MKITIQQLEEPRLEFAKGSTDAEPKRALAANGPFGVDKTKPLSEIVCGIVALPSEIWPIRNWIERMHSRLVSDEKIYVAIESFPASNRPFTFASKSMRGSFELLIWISPNV
jgi:hypothetical protein